MSHEDIKTVVPAEPGYRWIQLDLSFPKLIEEALGEWRKAESDVHARNAWLERNSLPIIAWKIGAKLDRDDFDSVTPVVYGEKMQPIVHEWNEMERRLIEHKRAVLFGVVHPYGRVDMHESVFASVEEFLMCASRLAVGAKSGGSAERASGKEMH